ncbi:MAG: hypothetical protein RLP12_11820, partial [Ekhidna sp.]
YIKEESGEYPKSVKINSRQKYEAHPGLSLAERNLSLKISGQFVTGKIRRIEASVIAARGKGNLNQV